MRFFNNSPERLGKGMLQFDELRLRLEGIKPDIDDLASALGIKKIKEEIEDLDGKAAAEGFWDDMDVRAEDPPALLRPQGQTGRIL